MKIIITYASCGRGHQSAAEAIYDCLKRDFPEHEAKIIGILDYTNSLFLRFYSGGYSLLASRLRFVWFLLYYLCANRFICKIFNFFCRFNSRRFISYLLSEKPQVILTTHFFPAEVISYLKKKGKLNPRLITVITDFGVHPLWVFKESDDYVVGTDYTRQQLISKGINVDRIKVFGIPVSLRFLSRYERKGPRFSVLLITGSFGFSLLEKIVEMLKSLEIHLYVVCGNNQRLYHQLTNKHYGWLEVFGFTQEIPQLLSQVDVMITKPGGIMIAESLAKDVPLIFIDGIPGQETGNARILENYGCAIRMRRLEDLKKLILELKNTPQKLDLMRQNIKKIKKPEAVKEICQYVYQGSVGFTC